MPARIHTTVFLALCMLLSACGVKGDLSLPRQDAVSGTPAAPATTRTRTQPTIPANQDIYAR